MKSLATLVSEQLDVPVDERWPYASLELAEGLPTSRGSPISELNFGILKPESFLLGAQSATSLASQDGSLSKAYIKKEM